MSLPLLGEHYKPDGPPALARPMVADGLFNPLRSIHENVDTADGDTSSAMPGPFTAGDSQRIQVHTAHPHVHG